MKLVKVKCAFCGKEFFRPSRRVNETKKFGWNQYCSRKCQNQVKIKRIEKVCANPSCNKKVSREPKEIKKSKLGHVFCSRSCAAIFNNSLRRKIKTCPVCNEEFYGKRKYCSKSCRPKPPTSSGLPLGYQRVTKRQIIKKIKDFYDTKGRIPLKREFNHYTAARLRFDTWNKAIIASGFKPNPVKFSKKFIANDGHICDSFSEKIIDDWLHNKNIKHERNVKYPGNSKLTADFVTKQHWIEFFGLSGELKRYDLLKNKKKKLAKKYKLPLMALYPNDLFPQNRLSEILKI